MASQGSKNTGVFGLEPHQASWLSDTIGIGMAAERYLVYQPIMCLSGKADGNAVPSCRGFSRNPRRPCRRADLQPRSSNTRTASWYCDRRIGGYDGIKEMR